MNKVLRTLMLSDLFIMGSFGLVQPIFAVFILNHIGGASVETIGIAVAIQLFTKALFQITVAKWADCELGNCRELYTLIIGSIIVTTVPLGYIFADSVQHIYLIQFLYGLGQALSFPSWRVIFTNYLDKGKAGFEWGVYDTVISLGIALSAALGAWSVEHLGFIPIFAFVSLASAIGTSFILTIFKQEFSCRIHLKKNN